MSGYDEKIPRFHANKQDVAATLATEEADDVGQVSKLRSALEAVEHKRRKVKFPYTFLTMMCLCTFVKIALDFPWLILAFHR